MYKPKSITKWLNEKYGGKWVYDGKASWWCDDGERHVSRVANGRDMEGEYTEAWSLCLYSKDKAEWLSISGFSSV